MGWVGRERGGEMRGRGGENQHSHSSTHLQLVYNAERTGGGKEQKVRVSSGGREVSKSTR